MATRRGLEAGEAVVVLGMDMTPLQRAVDAAQKKLESFGKGVMAFGAAFSGLGALVSAPFLYGLSVFSEWGKELVAGSRRTGIEIGLLGALAYATGADIDTLGASMDKLGSFLEEAAHGSAKADQALLELGLTFEQLNRMNQHDRLLAIADGLDRVADAGQRAALKRELLGRGAAGLNLSGGAAGVRQREERAVELGRSLSPEDQKAVIDYNLAMRELDATIKAVWNTLGATIAPFMTDFARMVTTVVQAIRNWLDNNRELVLTIFRVADAAVTLSTPIIAIGGAFYGASIALGFFMPMLTTLGAILGAMGSVITFVTGGMGIFGLATWAVSSAISFAAGGLGIVTAATWAYGVAVAAVSGITGLLVAGYGLLATAAAFAASGFGVMTAATWLSTAASSAAWGAWAFGAGIVAGTLGVVSAAHAMALMSSASFSAGLWLGTTAMIAYDVALGVGTATVAVFQGAVTVAAAAIAIFEGVLAFAAGGFGLFTVFALASAAASAIFEGGIWLGAVAMIAWDALVVAASAGFGLYTVFAFAASAASAVWEGMLWLGAAAMTAYNLALAVASGQISIFTLFQWAAGAGVLILKAGMWLASVAMAAYAAATGTAAVGTTVATGGVNLLIAALGLLIIAAGVAALALGGAFLLAPLVGFAMVFGSVLASLGTVGRFFDTTTAAGGKLADTLLDGANRIADGFMGMFGKLMDTGTKAFGGISDALKIGDMDLVWEIIKVSAQLAWLDISEFAQATWIELKAAFFATVDQLGDYLLDIFNDTWADLRVAWEMGCGFITYMWWTMAADLMTALEGPIRMIKSMLRAMTSIPGVGRAARAALESLDNAGIGHLGDVARQVANSAARDTADRTVQIQADREAQRQQDTQERAARDAAAEAARVTAQRDAATDPAERAALQKRLDDAAREARWQVLWAEFMDEMNPGGPEQPSGYSNEGKFGSLGTFSKDLSGLFGSTTTPAERAAATAALQLKEAEKLRKEAEDNRKVLEDIRNLLPLQFG